MAPVPWPKLAFENDKASTCQIKNIMGNHTLLWFNIFTCWGISQLSTSYSSIIRTPVIITHCTPLSFETDLHSAFIWYLSPNKSQVSPSAIIVNWERITNFHSNINYIDTQCADLAGYTSLQHFEHMCSCLWWGDYTVEGHSLIQCMQTGQSEQIQYPDQSSHLEENMHLLRKVQSWSHIFIQNQNNLTVCSISQLSTQYYGISMGPCVTTCCTPSAIETDLHSALKLVLTSY